MSKKTESLIKMFLYIVIIAIMMTVTFKCKYSLYNLDKRIEVLEKGVAAE